MAIHVSGSFSGIAHATGLPLPYLGTHPVEYYDGAPLTGTFSVDVVNPRFQVGGDNYAYYVNGPGSAFLVTYDIKDQHFSFSSEASVILLDNDGVGSTGKHAATFLTDFMPKYEGAIFTLTASADSLFSDLDPLSLRLDPGAAIGFDTTFADAQEVIRVDVEVGAVRFDPTPVPEPATAALLLVGCVLMACIGRLRAR